MREPWVADGIWIIMVRNNDNELTTLYANYTIPIPNSEEGSQGKVNEFGNVYWK